MKNLKLFKNFKLILGILIIFLIFMGGSKVKAAALLQDLSESYIAWSNLSEEEKSEVIAPLATEVTYSGDITSNLYSTASETTTYQLSGVNVKDQESTSGCWTFSVTSVLETNLYALLNTSYTFSTRHMEYATAYTFSDGYNTDSFNREVGDGGNAYVGLAYYTSGHGPVYETDMPFEDNEDLISLSEIQDKDIDWKINEYVSFPSIYKEYNDDGTITYYNGYSEDSDNYVEYTEDEVETMRNNMKAHIMQYGAITSSTYTGDDSSSYYNFSKISSGDSDTYAYYCDDSSLSIDHAVTIVGWDDNSSADNFNDEHKPSSDGAWIILNSWGDEVLNEGYLYISYDDAFVEKLLFGIVETTEVDYDNIYQYDPLGFSLEWAPETTSGNTLSSLYMANVFETTPEEDKTELLTEVSFYINTASSVDVYVNTESNDLTDLTYVGSMGELDPGYYTYTLDDPLELTGSEFVVSLKLESDVVYVPLECNYSSMGLTSNYWDTATSEEDQSFISIYGTTWYDLIDLGLVDTNICLKAFSVYESEEEEEEEDVDVTSITLDKTEASIEVGDSITLTATVLPSDATDTSVTWTSSDTSVVTVDEDGVVTGIAEGTATITVASNSNSSATATCEVTVTETTSTDTNTIEDTNTVDNTNTVDDTTTSTESSDDEEEETIAIVTTTVATSTSDTTTSTGTLPQTGGNMIIFIISITVLVAIGVCVGIKLYKNRDIK